MKINRNCCIVSVATGNYKKGLHRLSESLVNIGYKGDTLLFSETLPEGCPSHDDAPWAFKAFALKEAINKGYSKVIWLDSNMVCIRNPKTIFSKIEKDGYFVMNSYSNTLGEWCSDIALENFGIDREKAFQLYEISPQCLGINCKNKLAMQFLDNWIAFALDGTTFRGIPKEYPLDFIHNNKDFIVSKDPRVKGHRSDQTVATYLAWKYNLKRSYCEVKNIQATDEKGKNIYSRAISVEVEVIQNRDIKSDIYLETVDKWLNHKGANKLLYIVLSLVDTIKRRIFYIKNEHKLKNTHI